MRDFPFLDDADEFILLRREQTEIQGTERLAAGALTALPAELEPLTQWGQRPHTGSHDDASQGLQRGFLLLDATWEGPEESGRFSDEFSLYTRPYRTIHLPQAPAEPPPTPRPPKKKAAQGVLHLAFIRQEIPRIEVFSLVAGDEGATSFVMAHSRSQQVAYDGDEPVWRLADGEIYDASPAALDRGRPRR